MRKHPFCGDNMALINNIYVLVKTENVRNDVETVSHPTESGMPVSDTIRKKPIIIDLTGVIANTDEVTAKTAISKIKALQKSGSIIKYVGQAGTYTNLQIQSFNEDYTNKNYGGAGFDMTLKEIKTAKSAYVKTSSSQEKPDEIVSTKKTFSVGDIVIFAGGYVYVSSDATKAAANRGKSTCKLTGISTLPKAKHIYHLISTDGKKVYGWVDASKVSAKSSTTKGSSNGGTQQVQSKGKSAVYHTVKKGETIYKLVNVTYKGKGFSVSKTINNNPNAFSRKGDAKTLIVGARLRMY